MAQDRYANNSTDYEHPQESNLLNIHKVMQYNATGQPVARVHVDGITLEGDVIVDTVSLSSSTLAALETVNVVQSSTPWVVTGTVVVSNFPTTSTVYQGTNPWVVTGTVVVSNFPTSVTVTNFTSTVVVSNTVTISNTSFAVTNFPTTSTVYQGTIPWVTTVTNWPALQYVNGTVYAVQSGTWSVGVTGNVTVDNFTSTVNVASLPAVSGTVAISSLPAITGTVVVSNFTSTVRVDNFPNSVTVTNFTSTVYVSNTLTISNTSFAVTNFPTTSTVYQGTNPWNITGTVAISNPVTSVAITGTVQATFLDTEVTAFDEPLAIGITPVIQADAMYGLDPDFWVTSQLNGGVISITTNTTWEVQSGTSPGGYARLATAKYMTYQPGQGSMFRWTAAFTAATNTINTGTKHVYGVDNIVQNTGPIDREDGYSFGYSGATDSDGHRKIGILHRRAGRAETRSLTITVAPTGVQTATITLNSVPYTVSLTASTDVKYTANQIANALKANSVAENTWDIEGCNGTITFTYYSPGARNGTYSFSSTGAGTLAQGTFARTAEGITPNDTWTYVDDWDNKSIVFDPTKLNVYAVDLRWLGAGRVRFMMEEPSTGKMVLVHTQRWASQYTIPHINKPSLRVIYRSGTTNAAVTPSQNVIVTGASVFAGIQGMINQTGGSQAWYSIDSTTRAKDIVWHLLSLQNPFVRNNGVNKASILMQDLTVAAQGNDPSVLYIVKNAIGLSDVLVFQSIPNSNPSMFAQYSASALQENLAVERITNIQTLGINSSAQFKLADYNLALAPGETVSIFISSSNAINRTAVGMTWAID